MRRSVFDTFRRYERPKDVQEKTSGGFAGILSLYFVAVTALAFFYTISPAFAICSNPSGIAGQTYYNTTHSMLQYCDGSDWIAMGWQAPPNPYLDPDTMPTAGLIGYWKLDETSGTTVMDSSGNGNNGTMQYMSPATDRVSGKFGNALDFDGNNDRVSFGTPALFNNLNNFYTMSAWVKFTYNHNNHCCTRIFATYKNFGRYTGLELRTSGDGASALFGSRGSGSTGAIRGDYLISDDKWHLVTGVRNNNVFSLYIDGVFVRSVSGSIGDTTDMNNPWYLATSDTSAYFRGQIDDVRLYNRALSISEIRTLAGLPPPPPNLVGHWKLDETSGTMAYNSAGADIGSMINGLSATNDSVPGRVDRALDFDGTNDFICLDDAGTCDGSDSRALFDDGFSERTVTLWFKADDTSGTRVLYQEGGGSNGMNIYIMDGTLYGGAWAKSNGWNGAWLSEPVSSGQWYFVTLLFSSANMKMFVDGVSVGNAVPGIPMAAHGGDDTLGGLANTGTLFHNDDTQGGYYFDGQIDDFRVYDRILSATEVRELYCISSPGKVTYNTTYHVMEFCSDKGSHAMGPVVTSPPLEQNVLSGLVGWWKLNETIGSTTAADSSGNGNDGSVFITPDPMTWTTGKIGGSLDFDSGENEYITIGNPAVLNFGTGDFAVSFWAKRQSNATTNLRPLSKGAGGDNASEAGFAFFGADTTMAFIVNDGSGSITSLGCGSGLPLVGNWNHFVGVVERGADMRYYLNGVLCGSTPAPAGSVSGARSFDIARNSSGNDLNWDGQIDDVRLYNRALSAEEVKMIYTNSACANPNGSQGQLYYNTSFDVMQYCNGTEWIGIGK